MDIKELILTDMNKVRRDSNLMSLYLKHFQEAFNYRPNCAGCSFNSDWFKFVSFYSHNKDKSLILQKENEMNIVIKKASNKILSYVKDGKTFRLYDNILNDEFIENYLKYGSETEIEERKKLFVFPKIKKDEILNEVLEKKPLENKRNKFKK